VSDRRFSTLGVILVGAAGFLAGILLVAALGGAKGATRTTTITKTVRTAATNDGTVIVTTAVPDLVGERLPTARERIERAGFDVDVVGGGLLGVIVERNWEVVAQRPPAGEQREQGSTIQVEIERR
jgi:beta-lactam-binding protein with PASTA domain